MRTNLETKYQQILVSGISLNVGFREKLGKSQISVMAHLVFVSVDLSNTGSGDDPRWCNPIPTENISRRRIFHIFGDILFSVPTDSY